MKTKVHMIALSSFLLFNISCRQYEEEPYVMEFPAIVDPIPYDILGSGKLVFERVNGYNGICIIDIEKGWAWSIGEGQVTNGPSVSPNGDKIAYCDFTAIGSSAYDVYIVNIDGTNLQRVSDISGQEYSPSWTPDGNHILFYSFLFAPATGNQILYRQSPLINPTDLVPVVDFGKINPPTFYSPEGPASLSPKGKLAIRMEGGIYTCDADGTNFSKIIPQPLDSIYYNIFYSPSWSPDGNKLAALLLKSKLSEILSVAVIVFEPDGTKPDTLVTMPASGNSVWLGDNNYSVCWSPDGTKIAFTRPDAPDMGSHIYVIRTDHTGLTQVTNEPGATDRSLSWSK